MRRPYIICHMVQSIDGKVTGNFLSAPESEKAIEVYYELNRQYKADAFACGRVTMEGSFTGGWTPDLTEFDRVSVPHEDFIADPDARFFAVAFDRQGRLGWESSRIKDEDPGYGNAHIIEVLCDTVDDRYLAYLQSIGVSYIFAGAEDLDLSLALEKLLTLFGIKKLLLEGGSIINGAFQRTDMIDELSIVVAPVVGSAGDKLLFTDSVMSGFQLISVQTISDAVVLRYKFEVK